MYKNNRCISRKKQALRRTEDRATYKFLSEMMTPRIARSKEFFETLRAEEEKKTKRPADSGDFELVLLRRSRDRRIPEEEREKLKSVLLEINMPLVFRFAAQACANYVNFRIPFDDYFSECCRAFHDAILKYDFNKGTARLGNYAIFIMRDRTQKLICKMSPSASISKLYFSEHKKRCAGEPYKEAVLERSERFIYSNNLIFDSGEEAGLHNEDASSSIGAFDADAAPFSADEESIDRLFEKEYVEKLVSSAMEALTPEEQDAVCSVYGVCGRKQERLKTARKRTGMTAREYDNLVRRALLKMRRRIRPEEEDNVGA